MCATKLKGREITMETAMDSCLGVSSLTVVLLAHRPEMIPNAVYNVVTRKSLIESGDLTPPEGYDRFNSHFPNFDWQRGLVAVSYYDFNVVESRLQRWMDEYGVAVIGLIWCPEEDDLTEAYDDIVNRLAQSLNTTKDAVIDHPRVTFDCYAISPTERQVDTHSAHECRRLKMVLDTQARREVDDHAFEEGSSVANAVDMYRAMLVSSMIKVYEEKLSEQEQHLGIQLNSALNIGRSAPIHVTKSAIHLLTSASQQALTLRDDIDVVNYTSAACKLCDFLGDTDDIMTVIKLRNVIFCSEAVLLATADENDMLSTSEISSETLKQQLKKIVDASKKFLENGEKLLASETSFLSGCRMIFFQQKLRALSDGNARSSPTRSKKRYSFGLLRKNNDEDLPSLRETLIMSTCTAMENAKSASTLMRLLSCCTLLHYDQGHVRTSYVTLCWLTSRFIDRGAWSVAIFPCMTALALIGLPLVGSYEHYSLEGHPRKYPLVPRLLQAAAFLAYSLELYELYHLALSHLCAKLSKPLHTNTYAPTVQRRFLVQHSQTAEKKMFRDALELCMRKPLHAIALMSHPGRYHPLAMSTFSLEELKSLAINDQRLFASAVSRSLQMSFDKLHKAAPKLPHSAISWFSRKTAGAVNKSNGSPRRHTYAKGTKTNHFRVSETTRSTTMSLPKSIRSPVPSDEVYGSPPGSQEGDQTGNNRRSIQSPHAIVFGQSAQLSPSVKSIQSPSTRTPRQNNGNGQKSLGLDSIDLNMSVEDVDINGLFRSLLKLPVLPLHLCTKLLTFAGQHPDNIDDSNSVENEGLNSPVLRTLSSLSPASSPSKSLATTAHKLSNSGVIVHPLSRFCLNNLEIIYSAESTIASSNAREILAKALERMRRIIESKTIVYTSRRNGSSQALGRKVTELSLAENDSICIRASLRHRLGRLRGTKVALIGESFADGSSTVVGLSDEVFFEENEDVETELLIETGQIKSGCKTLTVAFVFDSLMLPAYVMSSCDLPKMTVFPRLLRLVPEHYSKPTMGRVSMNQSSLILPVLVEDKEADEDGISCAILVRRGTGQDPKFPVDFNKMEGKQAVLHPANERFINGEGIIDFECRTDVGDSCGFVKFPSEKFSLSLANEHLRAMTALIDATSGETLDAYLFYTTRSQSRERDWMRILAFDIEIPSDPYFISPSMGPFSANFAVLKEFWKNICWAYPDNSGKYSICCELDTVKVPKEILSHGINLYIRGIFKRQQYQIVQPVYLISPQAIEEIDSTDDLKVQSETSGKDLHVHLQGSATSSTQPIKVTFSVPDDPGGPNYSMKLKLCYAFVRSDPWHPAESEPSNREVDINLQLTE